MRESEPKLNKEKTRQVILYLLNELGPMSSEKLQYLLYFVSFDFYEKHEEHLTGVNFIKN